MRRVGQDPETHRFPVPATILQVLNRDAPTPRDVDQRDTLSGPFENLQVVTIRGNGKWAVTGCRCRLLRASACRTSGRVLTLYRRGSVAPRSAHWARRIAGLPRRPAFALRLVAHVFEYGTTLRSFAPSGFLERAYNAQKGATSAYEWSVILKLLRKCLRVPTSVNALMGGCYWAAKVVLRRQLWK